MRSVFDERVYSSVLREFSVVMFQVRIVKVLEDMCETNTSVECLFYKFKSLAYILNKLVSALTVIDLTKRSYPVFWALLVLKGQYTFKNCIFL